MTSVPSWCPATAMEGSQEHSLAPRWRDISSVATVEADHAGLAPHLNPAEDITSVHAGELLGPAVARGLDLGWGRVIGPEPSVLLVVTTSRVVVIRRHPGGRVDSVVWAVALPVAGILDPAIAGVVVLRHEGEQVVFRPTDPNAVDQLSDALRPA